MVNFKLSRKRLEFGVFIVARVIALLSKFSLLWILMQFGHKDASILISLYYLAFSSVMLLYSNEAHFHFYKDYFSDKKSGLALTLSAKKYMSLMIHQILIFSIPVFLASYYLVDSWLLAASFFGLLLLEKFLDELIRFKLFAKKFIQWSIIMVIKSVTPILFVLAFFNSDFPLGNIFILSSYLIFTFLVFWKTPPEILSLFRMALQSLSIKSFKEYFKGYVQFYFFNQVLSLSGRNILTIDRWFIKIFGLLKMLDQYTMIGQLANMVNIFIDYFFIASRRALYVQKLTSISKLSSGLLLPLLAIVGFAGYSLFIYVFFQFSTVAFIELPEAILMGFCFMMFAVTAPYSQFCFWHTKRKVVISIDLLYYFIAIVSIYLAPFESMITNILTALIIAHFVRFACLFGLSFSVVKKHQSLQNA